MEKKDTSGATISSTPLVVVSFSPSSWLVVWLRLVAWTSCLKNVCKNSAEMKFQLKFKVILLVWIQTTNGKSKTI